MHGTIYDYNLPTNHKYQAQPIEYGSQILGCSSLIYSSELDRPQDVDFEVCRRRIDNSKLKEAQKPIYEKKLTPEEIEALRIRNNQAVMLQKVQKYIRDQYGPHKNYSSKPNVYETGRAAWKKEDKQRGYVVFDRTVDIQLKAVYIVEHRYDMNGNISTHKFTIDISKIK